MLGDYKGNVKAQNNLGVMYYKGQGVVRNYVHAYKWLSLAHAEGNLRGTGKLLNMLEKSMTSPQIVQAQKLASQFTAQEEIPRGIASQK